jgi:hypothetical protein
VSLKNIPQYLRNGPVVIHAWDYNQQIPHWRNSENYNSILSQIKDFYGDRVKIVLCPVPQESKNIKDIHSDRWADWALQFANKTFHFAMYGISDALKHVETEYVLRTRSDEAYSNVDLFIEALCRDPKKFVMGNIFAAPMKNQEFHIGDHIYACKSEDLYHATNQLASFYYGYNKDPKWFYFQRPIGFEQVLAYSWMDCTGIDMSLPLRPENIESLPPMRRASPELRNFILSNSVQSDIKNREIRKQVAHDYFHVIDINKARPFRARWNHCGKTFIDQFQNPHGVYNTGDMLDGY